MKIASNIDKKIYSKRSMRFTYRREVVNIFLSLKIELVLEMDAFNNCVNCNIEPTDRGLAEF